MSDLLSEVTTCRVCGAEDWLDVLSLGDIPLANSYVLPGTPPEAEPRYPLDLAHCRNCLLVSLRHVVDPNVLYRDYIYISSDTDMVNDHMKAVTSYCAEVTDLESGDLVVEIGSNIGTQLVLFGANGQRVLGIDPAKNLQSVAERNGVPTIADFFTADVAAQAEDQHGCAKVILGRHVFAHIDDLTEVLAGVHALLHPRGVFAVEVPYLLDMVANNEFDTIYHEHLSYFSVHTLQQLFGRHGMHVVDVKRLAVHGGSILVFAAFADGPVRSRPAVPDMLAQEDRFGIADEATYRGFAERAEQTMTSLRELVRGLTAEGRTVAGYGAPAKGNTLLNACGITADDIAYCGDTTEAKQGRLLPGTRIPVRSPKYASEHPPDLYLLLAWNYAKEVVRRELPYLSCGGRFIVPIPDVLTLSAATLVDGFFDSRSR